jgi:hypothetical protein
MTTAVASRYLGYTLHITERTCRVTGPTGEYLGRKRTVSGARLLVRRHRRTRTA